MAAPRENSNAIRHGGRTLRHGMVLTALGRRYRHIQGYVHNLRKSLEAHVRKVHGDLSPMLVAEVNLAARYETTAAIALYQVSHGDDLPAAEVQSLLKTATWATAERNRCIARLGLKTDGQADSWAALYAPQQPVVEPDDASAEDDENAADASTDVQASESAQQEGTSP